LAVRRLAFLAAGLLGWRRVSAWLHSAKLLQVGNFALRSAKLRTKPFALLCERVHFPLKIAQTRLKRLHLVSEYKQLFSDLVSWAFVDNQKVNVINQIDQLHIDPFTLFQTECHA
jgi:hypothetical protein